MTIKII